jgi:hypothetical protein
MANQRELKLLLPEDCLQARAQHALSILIFQISVKGIFALRPTLVLLLNPTAITAHHDAAAVTVPPPTTALYSTAMLPLPHPGNGSCKAPLTYRGVAFYH